MNEIVEQDKAVRLTEHQWRKVGASLRMTATIQDALGRPAEALESLLLMEKVTDGLDT